MAELKAGVYRHYKNHLYLVLGQAHDANDPGREVVVYIGLELDDAKPGHRLAVRTVSDFFSYVAVDGHMVPRFVYLGPAWEPAMAVG